MFAMSLQIHISGLSSRCRLPLGPAGRPSRAGVLLPTRPDSGGGRLTCSGTELKPVICGQRILRPDQIRPQMFVNKPAELWLVHLQHPADGFRGRELPVLKRTVSLKVEALDRFGEVHVEQFLSLKRLVGDEHLAGDAASPVC